MTFISNPIRGYNILVIRVLFKISIRCICYTIFSFFITTIELSMFMFYVAEDNRLHFSEFPILNTMILGVYS